MTIESKFHSADNLRLALDVALADVNKTNPHAVSYPAKLLILDLVVAEWNATQSISYRVIGANGSVYWLQPIEVLDVEEAPEKPSKTSLSVMVRRVSTLENAWAWDATGEKFSFCLDLLEISAGDTAAQVDRATKAVDRLERNFVALLNL